MLKSILVFCFALYLCNGKVVSFIKPCSLKDEKCLASQATSVMKKLIPGNDEIKSPKLNPLVLPQVEVQGTDLHLKFKNLQVSGFDDAEIKSVKIDPATKKGEVKIFVPELHLNSDNYQFQGKVSLLTIDGEGKEKISAFNCDILYTFTFDLEKKSDGEYLKIVKDESKFTVTKVHFQFENLIKDNPALTDSTNQVLNDEWSTVVEDLRSGISGIVTNVIHLVTSTVFNKSPFSELTLP